jgi:RNA polymerase sigma-70 factor (ECF subfamily)
MARRLVGDEAEDLVQEALLRAFRSFGSLKEPGAGAGWVKAILVNAFRDRLRKEGRSIREVAMEDIDEFSLYRTVAEEDPFPYSDTLHLDFLHAFGREDVHAVLHRLPEIYRATLVLRYVEGYATKEIARLLEAPLGTVLARLHRGRKLFEQHMWSYAEEMGMLEREAVR